MDRKKLQILILIVLLLFLVIYGIYQLTSVGTQPQKETKTQPKPLTSIDTSKNLQQQIATKNNSYEISNLIDPFYPQIVRKDKAKAQGLLENFDIEELKLTGILMDNKEYKALIKTPDGRYFVVKERDRIGFKKGQITKISKNEIEIVETIKSPTGETFQTKKILKLRTEEVP